MDRLYVLDMPALTNFEADGKIIEYICDHFHKYNCDQVVRTDNLLQYGKTSGILKVIPISSVEHTRKWLNTNFHTSLKPIELPEVLMKYSPGYQKLTGEELLKLGYDNDKYFIKRIDKMKSWTSLMNPYESARPHISKNGLYAISPIHFVLAEYRIFVYCGDILGCQHYSGSPIAFPNEEIISKMVYEYITAPKAYTLDVMVTPEATIPLEVHPFVACGLYGFQDMKLLDMWEKGLDWYIKKEGR